MAYAVSLWFVAPWVLQVEPQANEQHFSQSVFCEWPQWDNDRGWSTAEELPFYSISLWAAVDDGAMGGRCMWGLGGGGCEGWGRGLKAWRCFALNCMAARCNRQQLEGAEWSTPRWAQAAAPIWHAQIHQRSSTGPRWLLFFSNLVLCTSYLSYRCLQEFGDVSKARYQLMI